MFIFSRQLSGRLALMLILAAAGLPALGAKEDFAALSKHTLAEVHATSFRTGDLAGCVSLYSADAKFFVDHQLVAAGEAELMKFYTRLRENDGIRKIEAGEFLDTGSHGSVGWVIFNYTKEYDLKGRDAQFLKAHKLEGFSTLKIKQYATAIFVKRDGTWKIRTMSVFDPEIWEPQK
jgi:hypothetical protein